MSSTSQIPIEGANAQPQNATTFEAFDASTTQANPQAAADNINTVNIQFSNSITLESSQPRATQATNSTSGDKNTTANPQPLNIIVLFISDAAVRHLIETDKNISAVTITDHNHPSCTELYLRGGGSGRNVPKTKKSKYNKVLRCNNCAKLHKRCDLNHPTCGRCADSGKVCNWPASALESTSEEEDDDDDLTLEQARSFKQQEDNMPSQNSRIPPKFDDEKSAEKEFKIPKDNRTAAAPDTIRTFRSGHVLDTRAAIAAGTSNTSSANLNPVQAAVSHARPGTAIRHKGKSAKGGKKKNKKGKKTKKGKKAQKDDESSSDEIAKEEDDDVIMEDIYDAPAEDRPTTGGKTIIPTMTAAGPALQPISQVAGNVRRYPPHRPSGGSNPFGTQQATLDATTAQERGESRGRAQSTMRAAGPSTQPTSQVAGNVRRYPRHRPSGGSNPFGIPQATLEAITAQEHGEYRDMAQATRAINNRRPDPTQALSYSQDDFYSTMFPDEPSYDQDQNAGLMSYHQTDFSSASPYARGIAYNSQQGSNPGAMSYEQNDFSASYNPHQDSDAGALSHSQVEDLSRMLVDEPTYNPLQGHDAGAMSFIDDDLYSASPAPETAYNPRQVNEAQAASTPWEEFTAATATARGAARNRRGAAANHPAPQRSEDDLAASMSAAAAQRSPPLQPVVGAEEEESSDSDSEYPPPGVRPPGVPANPVAERQAQLDGLAARFSRARAWLASGQAHIGASIDDAANDSSSEESLPDADLGQWDPPQGSADRDETGERTPSFLRAYFERPRSPTPDPEPVTRDSSVDYYGMAGITEEDLNEASEFYKYF
ncbi:hypothetical protein BP6252_00735 [Coleophoma cylindrospora]|uniref:Zn(2)-C6 fungal-type domain-containing protein n=1 Tax=Coleophoma cylindrospora TaxID=1849047 RepID=A0A3D8SQV9_9HELO|nr:hypothetical protein BP6252_00735 [Coleophoma cylindrospora]